MNIKRGRKKGYLKIENLYVLVVLTARFNCRYYFSENLLMLIVGGLRYKSVFLTDNPRSLSFFSIKNHITSHRNSGASFPKVMSN